MWEIKAQVLEPMYVNMAERTYREFGDGQRWCMVTIYDPNSNGNFRKMLVHPAQLDEIEEWRGLARVSGIVVRMSAKLVNGNWKRTMNTYCVLSQIAQSDPVSAVTADTMREAVDDELLSVLDRLETQTESFKKFQEGDEKRKEVREERRRKREEKRKAKEEAEKAEIHFAGEENDDGWA